LHGQSLDHFHASTTAWAPVRREGGANRLIDIASMGFMRHVGSGQQPVTLRELGSTVCIGEEAIVASTAKTGGRYM
jgi:hypothetical protein